MLSKEQKIKFLEEHIELEEGILKVVKEEPEKKEFNFKLSISDHEGFIKNFKYIKEVLEEEKFRVHCRAIGSSVKSSKDVKNKNKSLRVGGLER